MGWIKDEYTFPRRAVILEIRRLDMLNVEAFIQSPVILEELLRSLIEKNMSSVRGCTLLGMRFNYDKAAWDVTIEHPSLDIVEDGCMPPRLRAEDMGGDINPGNGGES